MGAIKPVSLDGGQEKLRAVAKRKKTLAYSEEVAGLDIRVGASVGHGEDTGASVLELEVLVGEGLAVDGLATSTVVSGEVTTLEHELGDDTVEGRVGVAEALLTGAESAEVLGCLGNVVAE